MPTYEPVDGARLAPVLAGIPAVRERLGGQAANWHGTSITSAQATFYPSPVEKQQSFAVDAQGRPAHPWPPHCRCCSCCPVTS